MENHERKTVPSSHQPTPTCRPCEGTVLEVGPTFPVKPSDDVLTETSSEILSQNHTAELLPNSWLSETVRQ